MPAGLRLTLGGAPAVHHFVPGLPGLYHPVHPTPITAAGISPEQAKAADADPGMHLELVDIPSKDIGRLTDLHDQAIIESRGGISEARRTALPGPEADLINDAIQASTTPLEDIATDPVEESA